MSKGKFEYQSKLKIYEVNHLLFIDLNLYGKDEFFGEDVSRMLR